MADVISGPKGRFVQGDAFTPNTKDQQGNPLIVKTGPNKGQPTQQYFMAVAYPKNDPETLPYLMKMAAVGAVSWPTFFPQGALPAPPLFGSTHPRFSMKVTDGDGVDDNGKRNAEKEGFAGHWVVKYSSSFAPKVYEAGKYSDMERVDIDKAKHSLLKRGYFVRVGASFENNQNDQRPGIYSNLQMVEIVHAGPEIVGGPDAGQVFGGGGVSHTSDRTGGLTMLNGANYDAFKQAGWTDEQMIAAGHATRPAAPPPTPPAPQTPPAPAGLVATGKDGYTLESLRAAGWTDDQIVNGGYAMRPAAPPVPPSPGATPPPPGANTHGANTAPGTPAPGGPANPSVTQSHSSYTGYMTGGTTPPPPPTPGRVMLPAAGTNTYEQLIAAGWNDQMLITHGMMAG
jgi:hypothetical protein